MSAHLCPACAALGIQSIGEYRGTYKSRYAGLRYRRYDCGNGHKWREDLAGAQVDVKRGRLPRTEENRLIRYEGRSVKETPCLLSATWTGITAMEEPA